MPNMFRLTYEPAQEGNVTNDWKRFPGRDDPDADTKMMIEAAHTARMARKNQNPVAVARAKKLAREKQKTDVDFSTNLVRKTLTENRKTPVRKTHTTGSPQKPARLSTSRGGGKARLYADLSRHLRYTRCCDGTTEEAIEQTKSRADSRPSRAAIERQARPLD
jgi:hypothetical protein